MNAAIINISAYKFIQLDKLPTLKAHFLAHGQRLNIKGTILLAAEGINLMLSAPRQVMDEFLAILRADARFADIIPKESVSAQPVFARFKVRIKKEIISMGDPTVTPQTKTAEHLNPKIFKQWLDEGRDITVLDTRNDYEVSAGTFDKAIDLNIENFRDFPQACSQLEQLNKDKPVVMFCTGGVRCEKAALPVMQLGFKSVYQLDGGIIKYFELCGGAHYQGHCFVFDERELVDTQLQPVKERE